MKWLSPICIFAVILIAAANAQQTPHAALQEGVSVHMPVAHHAVEVQAADNPDATVVAVMADGKVFVGAEPATPGALSNLKAATVYVKADSRAPFQNVLTVLDALRGKSVVLLAASPDKADNTKIVPPYGIKVIVPR